MKIEVQFFSRLRDLAGGVNRYELDLPADATVGEALARVFTEHPRIQAWDAHLLLAVGLDFVLREHVLHDGETLSVMPPVQGG